MTRLFDLALFALVLAVAEAVLIFGAFPVAWRRLRVWRVRHRLQKAHEGKVIHLKRRLP